MTLSWLDAISGNHHHKLAVSVRFHNDLPGRAAVPSFDSPAAWNSIWPQPRGAGQHATHVDFIEVAVRHESGQVFVGRDGHMERMVAARITSLQLFGDEAHAARVSPWEPA